VSREQAAIAELEPAADALREGNLDAALEALVSARPEELGNFAAKHVRASRSTRSDEVARYIFDWLAKRNGGQLRSSIGSLMSAWDRADAIDELAYIITHNGHPPNWVNEPEEES
jgi:hypothetical protein